MSAGRAPAISVAGLSRHFDGVYAVREVNSLSRTVVRPR